MVKRPQVLKRISGDFSPEADFAARQITKEDFPGRYPYRDYGLQYWEATHTWVKEYLDVSLLAVPKPLQPIDVVQDKGCHKSFADQLLTYGAAK